MNLAHRSKKISGRVWKGVLLQPGHNKTRGTSLEFDVYVGEHVEAINRAYMEIASPNLAYPMMIPTFIG